MCRDSGRCGRNCRICRWNGFVCGPRVRVGKARACRRCRNLRPGCRRRRARTVARNRAPWRKGREVVCSLASGLCASRDALRRIYSKMPWGHWHKGGRPMWRNVPQECFRPKLTQGWCFRLCSRVFSRCCLSPCRCIRRWFRLRRLRE